MNPGDTAKLLTDVFSNFYRGSSKPQYAKRGDKVKIISISQPAAIVEGKERFAVNVNQLQILT